ncbi:MAG: hypothetical protein GYA18_07520 [Chloroflexi bacterium]|nr:hypothetical protein [Chloroflexota bacterium]
MKRFVINVLVVGALLLTACAGGSETSTEGNDLQVPQVSSATENSIPQVADGSHQQTEAPVDMDERPVDDQTKLIVGIIKLEGTDQTITSEQAANLISLWNSLLELTQSQEDVTQGQVDALVEQIKAVLSAEQLAAIEAMVIDQQTVLVFMQEHDIEMDGMQRGQGDGQSFPQGTPSTDQMNKPDQGNPADAGTPAAGAPGGNAPRGTPAADQGQPGDGQRQQPGRMGGLSFVSSALIETLLALLESK